MFTEHEELRQATLIAFYGPKPPEFEQLLLKCQDMIHDTPGVDFRPYDIEQIHATIIGLEKEPGDELINRNMSCYRGKQVVMDIAGFACYLQASPRFPLRLQFGGFVPNDAPFTSRGQSPYERSFSIQGDKVVLIGWPVVTVQSPYHQSPLSLRERGQMCPEIEQLPLMTGLTNGQPRIRDLVNPNNPDADLPLDTVRKSAQAFNILHAYHASKQDVDNDFYLRLGEINVEKMNESYMKELEHKMQIWLSHSPLNLELSLRDLLVASYMDERLPMSSTRKVEIGHICPNKKVAEMLYE